MNINKQLYKNLDILLSISNKKENINSYTSSQNINNKETTFNTLLELTKIIEKTLFEKVLLEILIFSPNGKKSFHKDFNIIFNIFKKIYEARDTKTIFKSNNLNSIRLSYSNYILKFILSLDYKEFDFIESLLDNFYKKIFRTIYQKYKHTQSKELYKALSKLFFLIKGDPAFLNVTNTTILNPYIKRNKYIIIPDNNANNFKKLYFILFVVFSSFINGIHSFPNIISFLKKVLLNYNKNTISVEPSEEVEFAIVLGFLCNFEFFIFIDTISKNIIEEKKPNIDTRVKSSKDISDLFELFLELNINNSKQLDYIFYYLVISDILEKLYPSKISSFGLSSSAGLSDPVINDPGFNNLFKLIENTINFFSDSNKIEHFRSNSLIVLKQNINLINTKKYNELHILNNIGNYIDIFKLGQLIKELNGKILLINNDINNKNIKDIENKKIIIPSIKLSV